MLAASGKAEADLGKEPGKEWSHRTKAGEYLLWLFNSRDRMLTPQLILKSNWGVLPGKAFCRKILRAAVRTLSLRNSGERLVDASGCAQAPNFAQGLRSSSEPMQCDGWRHSCHRAQPFLHLCIPRHSQAQNHLHFCLPRQRGALSVTSILVSMKLRPLLWGSYLPPKSYGNCFCRPRGENRQGFTQSHDQGNVCLMGLLLATLSFLSFYTAEHRSLEFTLGLQSVIYTYTCIVVLLFLKCVSICCT